MLFIDNRAGSSELIDPLQKMGLPVESTRLDFGDIAFEGQGPKQKTLQIGIEFKRLSDLVSSLRDGRLLGHQAPGMLGEQGSYDIAWLLVEGQFRRDKSGRIAIYKGVRGWVPLPGQMLVSEMEKRLLTLELACCFHVRFVNTRHDTLGFLHSLYRWWTDKEFAKHQSHITVHAPQSFLPLSDFRKAVMQWPGVGRKASLAVEQAFRGSLVKAATASSAEWAGIEIIGDNGKSRRFGTKPAETICAFLRGTRTT